MFFKNSERTVDFCVCVSAIFLGMLQFSNRPLPLIELQIRHCGISLSDFKVNSRDIYIYFNKSRYR